MTDVLSLTAHLPTVDVADGEAIITEGSAGGDIWVLEAGSLHITKSGQVINTITHPGAVIGEMSVLLGTGHTATVVAAEPSRLRYAAEGAELLGSDPAFTQLVAVGLAERLAFVTTYLSDLKHQYGDAPGLAMVADVLQQLGQRTGPRAVPGSARDPDPTY